MERKTLFKTILYKETGSRHIERNKNCEDNVFRYISENGITSIALSDGAGSYKYAEKGSEITARMAATFMAKKFERLYGLDNETIADYVIREVLIPLGEEAEKQGEDIIEFSATLLCTAFHPDGRYLILHVGDGAIVGLNKNNECEVMRVSMKKNCVVFRKTARVFKLPFWMQKTENSCYFLRKKIWKIP